jgi:putative spermidine/putrescine transport system substrate-binding protein
MNKSVLPGSRRKFLSAMGGAGAIAVAAPFIITPRRAFAAGKMVLVSYGGSYRVAIEDALVKPFSQEFGVDVTVVDTPDLAKVKAQQMTGNVEWDVFECPGPQAANGMKAGYWEALDPGLFDTKDMVVAVKNGMVPFYLFAGGICWDKAKFAEGKAPRTFAEFWDVKKFPGARALRNRPSETIEFALLADGVPANKLYPLDIERAFKALERIKPHITKWVDETPQTVALVERGEIDFSYTYSARVKAQPKLAFSFEQNLHALEYFTVLKNAPNKANGTKFVQFALRPDRQAALMTALGYAPISRKAVSLVNGDTRKWFPNLENANSVVLNDEFWTERLDVVGRRFKEWVLA